MKKALYIITLLAVGITAYFTGSTVKIATVDASNNSISIQKQTEIAQDRFIDTESEEFKENYIDLRTVTGYSGKDNSLMLYTDDGNGYYLEIERVRN